MLGVLTYLFYLLSKPIIPIHDKQSFACFPLAMFRLVIRSDCKCTKISSILQIFVNKIV